MKLIVTKIAEDKFVFEGKTRNSLTTAIDVSCKTHFCAWEFKEILDEADVDSVIEIGPQR